MLGRSRLDAAAFVILATLAACDGEARAHRVTVATPSAPKGDDTQEVEAAPPEFVAPLETGASVVLDSGDCVEVHMEIRDADSPRIDLSVDAPPAIGGATLTEDANGFSGVWRWCPGAFGEPPAPGRYELVLLADDGDHLPAALPFELDVVQAPPSEEPPADCDEGWPTAEHEPPTIAEDGSVTVSVFVQDELGIVGYPRLAFSFAEPGEGEGGATAQTAMGLLEGDRNAGLWGVDLVAPEGDVWYRVIVEDGIPDTPCGHRLELPTEGWYHATR